MRTTKLLVIAGLLALTLTLPLATGAANSGRSLSKKEVKTLLANARTPEDHLKLASHYRQDATRLEQKARWHEEMRAIYLKSPLPTDGKLRDSLQMPNHCAGIVSNLRKAAENAKTLAAEHEGMARTASQQ